MVQYIDRFAPFEQVKTDWKRLEELAVGGSFLVKQSESGYRGASKAICSWANKLGTRYSIRTTPEGKVVSRVY